MDQRGWKIFVGNIDAKTISTKELSVWFAQYGPVSDVWISKHNNFGFVYMKCRYNAEKAAQGLHRKVRKRRTLIVELSLHNFQRNHKENDERTRQNESGDEDVTNEPLQDKMNILETEMDQNFLGSSRLEENEAQEIAAMDHVIDRLGESSSPPSVEFCEAIIKNIVEHLKSPPVRNILLLSKLWNILTIILDKGWINTLTQVPALSHELMAFAIQLIIKHDHLLPLGNQTLCNRVAKFVSCPSVVRIGCESTLSAELCLKLGIDAPDYLLCPRNCLADFVHKRGKKQQLLSVILVKEGYVRECPVEVIKFKTSVCNNNRLEEFVPVWCDNNGLLFGHVGRESMEDVKVISQGVKTFLEKEPISLEVEETVRIGDFLACRIQDLEVELSNKKLVSKLPHLSARTQYLERLEDGSVRVWLPDFCLCATVSAHNAFKLDPDFGKVLPQGKLCSIAGVRRRFSPSLLRPVIYVATEMLSSVSGACEAVKDVFTSAKNLLELLEVVPLGSRRLLFIFLSKLVRCGSIRRIFLSEKHIVFLCLEHLRVSADSGRSDLADAIFDFLHLLLGGEFFGIPVSVPDNFCDVLGHVNAKLPSLSSRSEELLKLFSEVEEKIRHEYRQALRDRDQLRGRSRSRSRISSSSSRSGSRPRTPVSRKREMAVEGQRIMNVNREVELDETIDYLSTDYRPKEPFLIGLDAIKGLDILEPEYTLPTELQPQKTYKINSPVDLACSFDVELLTVDRLDNVSKISLAKIICGMLNSGGGSIYIGFINGQVRGVVTNADERDEFRIEADWSMHLCGGGYGCRIHLDKRPVGHKKICNYTPVRDLVCRLSVFFKTFKASYNRTRGRSLEDIFGHRLDPSVPTASWTVRSDPVVGNNDGKERSIIVIDLQNLENLADGSIVFSFQDRAYVRDGIYTQAICAQQVQELVMRRVLEERLHLVQKLEKRKAELLALRSGRTIIPISKRFAQLRLGSLPPENGTASK